MVNVNFNQGYGCRPWRSEPKNESARQKTQLVIVNNRLGLIGSGVRVSAALSGTSACAERLGRIGPIGAPEELRKSARIAEPVLGGNSQQ